MTATELRTPPLGREGGNKRKRETALVFEPKVFAVAKHALTDRTRFCPPFVGVTSHTGFDASLAKRDLLVVDQLAIPGLPYLLDHLLRDQQEATLADLEWLQKQEVITEARLLADQNTVDELRAAEKDLRGAPNIFTRLVARALRVTNGVDSVALETPGPLAGRTYWVQREASGSSAYTVQAHCERGERQLDFTELLRRLQGETVPRPSVPVGEALRVTLLAFPQPDEQTSWERLLEFKDENKDLRTRLRHWITHVATKLGDTVEIAQEIEYLRAEYQSCMERHKLRIYKGSIETTVVGGATLLEDIAKLKLGEATKQLFTVQHQRIALLDSEAETPGREISYLIAAHEEFGSKGR